jgi:hypothetical protein
VSANSALTSAGRVRGEQLKQRTTPRRFERLVSRRLVVMASKKGSCVLAGAREKVREDMDSSNQGLPVRRRVSDPESGQRDAFRSPTLAISQIRLDPTPSVNSRIAPPNPLGLSKEPIETENSQPAFFPSPSRVSQLTAESECSQPHAFLLGGRCPACPSATRSESEMLLRA